MNSGVIVSIILLMWASGAYAIASAWQYRRQKFFWSVIDAVGSTALFALGVLIVLTFGGMLS